VEPPLSAVFLVKNEADRLPAALASVAWADEVLVVDTGSEDATREVAAAAGARVVSVPWEGWVASRNRALAQARHDWVLFLDADERVAPPLAREIAEALASRCDRASGFSMPRLSTFLWTPIRHGTWYPDRKLRLARRSMRFRAEGGRVHERLLVDGPVERLATPLHHDTYRDLSDALQKTVLYARLSAEDRFERGARGGVLSLLVRPPLELLRSYVIKLGFLDGAAGLAVAVLHALSYALRAAFLIELRHGRRMPSRADVQRAHLAPEPAHPAEEIGR
jgi:glycosyltransferase involved in cell wall biosynthesis